MALGDLQVRARRNGGPAHGNANSGCIGTAVRCVAGTRWQRPAPAGGQACPLGCGDSQDEFGPVELLKRGLRRIRTARPIASRSSQTPLRERTPMAPGAASACAARRAAGGSPVAQELRPLGVLISLDALLGSPTPTAARGILLSAQVSSGPFWHGAADNAATLVGLP
jgi:hypothetical protein